MKAKKVLIFSEAAPPCGEGNKYSARPATKVNVEYRVAAPFDMLTITSAFLN